MPHKSSASEVWLLLNILNVWMDSMLMLTDLFIAYVVVFSSMEKE